MIKMNNITYTIGVYITAGKIVQFTSVMLYNRENKKIATRQKKIESKYIIYKIGKIETLESKHLNYWSFG